MRRMFHSIISSSAKLYENGIVPGFDYAEPNSLPFILCK